MYRRFLEKLRSPFFDYFCDSYESTIHNQLNAKQMENRIVSGGETTHQAFAVTLRMNDMVNIACVHRIFCYPGSFTESSPWDNKLFGILGDITANQIPLVHIAPEVFAVAGLLGVCSYPPNYG